MEQLIDHYIYIRAAAALVAALLMCYPVVGWIIKCYKKNANVSDKRQLLTWVCAIFAPLTAFTSFLLYFFTANDSKNRIDIVGLLLRRLFNFDIRGGLYDIFYISMRNKP